MILLEREPSTRQVRVLATFGIGGKLLTAFPGPNIPCLGNKAMHLYNGTDGWTGPLGYLSLSSVSLVDKVQLPGSGILPLPVLYFPINNPSWNTARIKGRSKHPL